VATSDLNMASFLNCAAVFRIGHKRNLVTLSF
jgi:hypothetical protein